MEEIPSHRRERGGLGSLRTLFTAKNYRGLLLALRDILLAPSLTQCCINRGDNSQQTPFGGCEGWLQASLHPPRLKVSPALQYSHPHAILAAVAPGGKAGKDIFHANRR